MKLKPAPAHSAIDVLDDHLIVKLLRNAARKPAKRRANRLKRKLS